MFEGKMQPQYQCLILSHVVSARELEVIRHGVTFAPRVDQGDTYTCSVFQMGAIYVKGP